MLSLTTSHTNVGAQWLRVAARQVWSIIGTVRNSTFEKGGPSNTVAARLFHRDDDDGKTLSLRALPR